MSKWISDAYIKRLLQNSRLLQGNCEYKLWEQEVEKTVDAMPSIDIEPKRGKWIWDEQILGLVCSECKELGVERSNFCPYCGADMREVRDE